MTHALRDCVCPSQAAARGPPRGALYDPGDPGTPYRQGTAREDHALHVAFRRSLAEQGGGSQDAEEQLRAALAASLEVWAPANILGSPSLDTLRDVPGRRALLVLG